MYKLLIKLLVATFALFVVPVLTVSGQSIVLNEIMASNSFTVYDEDGDSEDWIEIYNYGQNHLNLEGWGLSDNEDIPFKWVFPDITLEPDEYLFLWASNKNRVDPAGELHTNFAISADGEEIIITSPDGNRVDKLIPTPMSSDISIGRTPDNRDNWYFFEEPTPDTVNSTPPLQDILEQPAFNHQPGFYTGPFMLEIEHEDPHAEIYYTLDGSEPGEDSELYNSPIEIQSLAEKPNSFSEILTSRLGNGSAWNPPEGVVEKANIIRAKAFRPGLGTNLIPVREILLSGEEAGNDQLRLSYLAKMVLWVFVKMRGYESMAV